MKAYTDLEQSKKLAEILSLESADMKILPFTQREYRIVPINDIAVCGREDEIPAWSLTALISILPFHLVVDNKRYAFSMIKGLDKNGETYAIKYVIFNTTFYFHLTDFYNNPVDACYEMILKLHELNLL